METESVFRRHERLVVALATTAVGALAVAGALPETVAEGSFFAGLGLALLLQGLARDLFTLAHRAKRRREGAAGGGTEHLACMCLESTVGLPLVLGGVALTVAAADSVLSLAPWVWPLCAGLVWGAGYAIRDLVVEWRPRWRIKRVSNHGSILVQWRAPVAKL